MVGPDFVITALSRGYKMDEGVLVLGAVPYVLRQELKSSRALEKTTIFCATCSPCSKLIPSFELGWEQVALTWFLSGDEKLTFFARMRAG